MRVLLAMAGLPTFLPIFNYSRRVHAPLVASSTISYLVTWLIFSVCSQYESGHLFDSLYGTRFSRSASVRRALNYPSPPHSFSVFFFGYGRAVPRDHVMGLHKPEGRRIFPSRARLDRGWMDRKAAVTGLTCT
jgi:hypothetical protein